MNFLVIDDHKIIYTGLKLLIEKEYENASVDYAMSSDSALNCLEHKSFDLIVLDINIPQTDSQQLMDLIFSKRSDQKILIFSTNPGRIYAKKFLKQGAKGYLNKEADFGQIKQAFSTILMGNIYMSQEVMQILSKDLINGNSENTFDNLSPREMDIVMHLLNGLGGKEISNVMNIHTSTVATHKSKIFQKLSINNLMEMFHLARLNQLTS